MKDPRIGLLHIRDAIASIRSYTSGLDFLGYETRPMVRDAVERNIERLSEAARHLPEEWTNPYPEIPWRALPDIGSAIRHGYDGIDDRAIWKTVVDDLPALGMVIDEMIRQRLPPREDRIASTVGCAYGKSDDPQPRSGREGAASPAPRRPWAIGG